MKKKLWGRKLSCPSIFWLLWLLKRQLELLICDGIFDRVHRLLSSSENIVWLQMSMWDKRYVIGCVYILPENSSYMNEYTWDGLIEEYVN